MNDANPSRDLPLYKAVERGLTDALTRGEWKPGSAIPPERSLCERFGVSIGTLRKAIDELVAENVLVRQQGRGTFVVSHDRERELFHFLHVVPRDAPKQYPEVQLASFTRGKADRSISVALAIDRGDPIYRIRNVLRFGDAPVIVDDIALPVRRFKGLTERRFRERRSTIYNLYQESFGIFVVTARERLCGTLLPQARAHAAHQRYRVRAAGARRAQALLSADRCTQARAHRASGMTSGIT